MPGELRGIEYLHKTYAKLPWNRLFAPSIHIVRDGFVVSQDLVDIFNDEDDPSFLTNDPSWEMDFAPNGSLVKAGDTMTRKRYADLLKTVSREGPDLFYAGKIANATITTIQLANGTMSLQDLEDYKVALRTLLDITYRGFKITSCGAPASGPVVLSVMKTIEGYSDIGYSQSINLSTHHLDEAMRFGYGAVRLFFMVYGSHPLTLTCIPTANRTRGPFFCSKHQLLSARNDTGWHRQQDSV